MFIALPGRAVDAKESRDVNLQHSGDLRCSLAVGRVDLLSMDGWMDGWINKWMDVIVTLSAEDDDDCDDDADDDDDNDDKDEDEDD